MTAVTAAATLARPHVWRDGDRSTPLLLLHGTGGDEHQMLALADALAPGAAVLSPRGAVLEGTAPRFFRRLTEGVFDEADLAARTDELADFVLAASTAHGVDPTAWVAVGFSNGANITSSLVLRRPDVLAGAVLLAAMVPFTTPPSPAALPAGPAGDGARRRWAVVATGRRDPMATAAQTRRLVADLGAAGVDVTELPHALGHVVDLRQVPELSRLIASGGRAGS